MSIDEVIKRTKAIETLLVKLGGTGRGLYAKMDAIKDQLDERKQRRIRFIATVRNKLVHDANVELTPDLFRDFCSACDDVHAYLKELIQEKEAARRRQAEREKQEAMARLRPRHSSGGASRSGGGGDYTWKHAAGLAVGVVGLGIYYWRQLTR